MTNTILNPSAGSYVDVNGLRTFYIQRGAGEPVVLIHGAAPGTCAQIAWHLNIEPLARAGFTVYAFDQPGFGFSADPDDYSMEYRVIHTQAFIDKMGLQRFHVIGNSAGAYIAARLALEDPRVQKLVLVASSTLAPRGSEEAQALARRHSDELAAFTPDRERVRTMTLRTLFHSHLVTDELVDARLAMSSGRYLEAHRKRRHAPRPPSIVERLSALQVPTLILWGTDDAGATLERGVLLFQSIPNCEFHAFTRCAHWVQWDQAARFNRLVADFLRAGGTSDDRRGGFGTAAPS